jgi:AraC-like DNA-binding protein
MLKNNARHPNPKNNPYLARLLADFEELCGKQEEVFGKAIFEYQLAARMEEARKMLLENELTTKAIAAKVGYKNTTSFISKFKDHFGYPPGAIQK